MAKLKTTLGLSASRDLDTLRGLGVPTRDGKREKNKDQSSPPLKFVARMKAFLTLCTSEYNTIIAEAVGIDGYMEPFSLVNRRLLIESVLLIQQQEFVMLRYLETLDEDAA